LLQCRKTKELFLEGSTEGGKELYLEGSTAGVIAIPPDSVPLKGIIHGFPNVRAADNPGR
jgi:hypothetical protein